MTMQVLMLRNRMVDGVLLSSGSTYAVADDDGAYLVANEWATRTDGTPDRVIAANVAMPTIDPSTGALVNSETTQPQLLPAVNGSIEIEIVLAGESKTLSASGVAGYRLIIHAAIATGAVTVTDSGGTYTLPVGCIGLFEFQPSGDVTLNNSSNTGGPITVLEIA